MDINEGDSIQCMNCHRDIFTVLSKNESRGTCEECLQAESNQVTVLQADNEAFSRELIVMESGFAHELDQYSAFEDDNMSV